MKKVLAYVLTLMMILSLCVPVMAEEDIDAAFVMEEASAEIEEEIIVKEEDEEEAALEEAPEEEAALDEAGTYEDVEVELYASDTTFLLSDTAGWAGDYQSALSRDHKLITFDIPSGKTVKSVSLGGTSIPIYESTETSVTLHGADMLDTIAENLETDGTTEDVDFIVNYSDSSSDTFTVKITTNWPGMTTVNTNKSAAAAETSVFEADEVEVNATNYPEFYVRNNNSNFASSLSGNNGTVKNHSVQSFLFTPANTTDIDGYLFKTNEFYPYGEVSGKKSTSSDIVMDIDFGVSVATTGFRFDLVNTSNWLSEVKVYGASTVNALESSLLGTATYTAETAAVNNEVSFEEEADCRFYRIKMTVGGVNTADGTMRLNEMRFTKQEPVPFFIYTDKAGNQAWASSSYDYNYVKLENKAGKEVASVKIGDYVIEHDESTSTAEIVLHRSALLPAYEYLATSAFDTERVNLTVTYEDSATDLYPVDFTAEWVSITDELPKTNNHAATVNFDDDEIDVRDYESFRVRTDSYNWEVNDINGNFEVAVKGLRSHPVNSFINTPVAFGNSTNYIYRSVNPDGNKHYVDVDFGEATKVGGFRYQLYSLGHYMEKVEVKGSDDLTEWRTLGTAAMSGNAFAYENDVDFAKNETYRYFRIFFTAEESLPFVSVNEMRFLKPGEKAEEPEEPDVADIRIKIDAVGGTVNSATENGITGDKVFAGGTAITLSAIAGPGSTFKYWIEVNTGRIIAADTALTLSGAVGRNVRAVFAADGTRFITFYGRDKNTVIGYDTSTGNGFEPNMSVVPDALRAYSAGYNLIGWKIDDTGDTLRAGNLGGEGTNYYAVYEVGERATYALTLGEGGSVNTAEITQSAIPYGTRLSVLAEDTTAEGSFMYWTQDGEIVSYLKNYTFVMPGKAITLNPVYGNGAATEEVKVALVVNPKEAANTDGSFMAGFMVARYVPEGVEVVDTGIIYVRDSAFGTLSVDKVGATAENGKDVRVSVSNGKGTGQYKFNARWTADKGIKAVAFITYKDGGVLKTVYSETRTIAKG